MSAVVRRKDFEAIEREWEEILPRSITNTIFVTPWWQKTWWKHFGAGQELCLFTVTDGAESLGIAPLMLENGTLSFVGGTDLFDYHDFLVLPGSEARFYELLYEHLLTLDWRRLELTSIPQGSPTLGILPALAERSGATVESAEEDVAPFVDLAGTWDGYLAGLRKKDRHELRRKMRRLDAADGARQYTCEDPETIPDGMQDFFRLHRASSAEKNAFMTPERERFFLDVAVELASQDRFKLYFLEVDGVRVASCICFDYDNSYLLYNSGYEPSYASLSVGLINKALCIQEAIEKGKRSFEFLRGSERYKYNLGGKDRAIHRMVVRR